MATSSTSELAVPSDVNEWLPAPAPFNDKKHGERAKFSGNNCIVERREPEKYLSCVAYTASPLPLGQVWRTTVVNTTMSGWSSGLKIGVTAFLPEKVPSYLPYKGTASSMEWLYGGRQLFHNKEETHFPSLPSLRPLSPGQTVGLLLTATGGLHIYLEGRPVMKVASGLPVNESLWGVVDVCGICSKIKSEMLNYPAEQILEAALKDGFIPHIDDVFLFHGPGGVGKSSLIEMFLGKKRDITRHSTELATDPLHLQLIRDVETMLFTGDWQVVNYERMSRMIAHTSDQLSRKPEGKRLEGKKGKKMENKQGEAQADDIQKMHERDGKEGEWKEEEADESEILSSGAFLAMPTAKKVSRSDIISRFMSTLRHVVKKSPKPITTTLGDDPDNIEGIFASFQQGLHDAIRESTDAHDVLFTHSIRILDSGGQPQFHELVSIFLPGITGIISVFKLSECLAVHGEVAFFKQGKSMNVPYESYYSNEQVIRHDLQVIQSEAARSGMEEMPNLAFVGTFRDEQDSCPETPDQKDERLHTIITEVLPEELQKCVITNGSTLNQVTFQVNAKEPDTVDFEAVGRLKGALVGQSRAQSTDLPLKWHGLEVALRMMMKELGRQSLRRRECEFIGHKLGFDLASLNAALDYLRKLNIISFYDVLPNVIFGSSQVILNKITDLICYSLELKGGKCAVVGAERKFVQQGIISLELLKTTALSKKCAQELFEPEDLVNVLISQLVLSEVGKKEYIVPCVLEVCSVYPSPPLPKGCLRSSFILLFSKKSPMCGIYCCTISSLLSDAGWVLLKEGGEVIEVARNSITFQMPKSFPGKVIFRDPLSSYLEVILEFPPVKHIQKLYNEIRNAFLVAIKRAMKTLNYKVRAPDVSFLCPVQNVRCSALPHPATVDDSLNYLKCSLKPGSVWDDLTSDQMMWLPVVTGLRRQKKKTPMSVPASASPRLDDEISERDLAIIARDHLNHWESLRPFLGLSRSTETHIGQSYPKNYNQQKRECLQAWKEKNGKDATYSALIKAAEDAKDQKLADNVKAMLT